MNPKICLSRGIAEGSHNHPTRHSPLSSAMINSCYQKSIGCDRTRFVLCFATVENITRTRQWNVLGLKSMTARSTHQFTALTTKWYANAVETFTSGEHSLYGPLFRSHTSRSSNIGVHSHSHTYIHELQSI